MGMILTAYLCVRHGFGLLYVVKSNCDLNSDCDSEIAERRLSAKRRKGFSSSTKSVQNSMSGSKSSLSYASDGKILLFL